TVGKYVKEVTELAEKLREDTVETNRLIAEKVLVAAADPTLTFVPPTPKPEVPYLDFAPLQNALASLKKSAEHFETARKEAVQADSFPPSEAACSSLDKALLHLERTLTRPEGLPRRPWYQHLLYAPGFYTGYGVKTLPGVREAIEERNWPEATQQIEFVAAALVNFSKELDRCSEFLSQPSR
ncbi:MAG: transferrin receptor-like dimerization domain-containing protein, partial [Candidatus Dormibacteraceae bacterium]